MNESKKPPSEKDFLPSLKEMFESNNVNDGTFGNITVIDEAKCYN